MCRSIERADLVVSYCCRRRLSISKANHLLDLPCMTYLAYIFILSLLLIFIFCKKLNIIYYFFSYGKGKHSVQYENGLILFGAEGNGSYFKKRFEKTGSTPPLAQKQGQIILLKTLPFIFFR